MFESLRRRGLLGKVLLAFAAIYFVWGSTFLAIRIAITDIPPVLMCAIRLLTAGALLVAWARARGDAWPRGIEWRNAAFVGFLLPGVGNTSVTLGETHVASGLVALLVATIPLWIALLSMLGPHGERPSLMAWVGLALGFAGIALLMGPGLARPGHEGSPLAWALIPVVGAFSWAWGSLWSRRARMPGSAFMATGIGLVTGGAAAAVASALAGDFTRVQWAHVGVPALAALAYLIVFGSVLAFTCYVYLLRTVSAATVSTYAFVNPIVAMGLGWVFAGERLSARTLVAAALVVASVALITTTRARAASRRVAEQDAAA